MLDGHWEERRGVSRGGDPADQGAVKQSVMFGKLGKFTGKFTVLQAAPSVLARWYLSEEEGKGLPLPSLKGEGGLHVTNQVDPQREMNCHLCPHKASGSLQSWLSSQLPPSTCSSCPTPVGTQGFLISSETLVQAVRRQEF